MKMRRVHFRSQERKAAPVWLFTTIFFLLLSGSFPLQAQNAYAYSGRPAAQDAAFQNQQKVSLKLKNETLQTVLSKIEKQVAYTFVFSNDDIDARQRISIEVANSELTEVVDRIARIIGAEFEIINDKIILRSKSPASRKTITNSTMQDRTTFEPVVNSRDIPVGGVVTDENGKPVSGVSVYVKGTTIGTTTDNEGRFSLNIPEGRANTVLVFSSVNYREREVALLGQRTVNVSLTAANRSMDEVVVVGYGTQRRGSITGAVDRIDRSAIEGRPVTNLSTALQGTSPNLIIQQRNFEPGQPVSINIRGVNTLFNNSPMVVIDGIIGGDLNLINPNDVESVSILKDAGSAGIYGSRAANGVILVTTRKGRKNERAAISYTGNYGIQKPRITYTPVDAWENAYYKNVSLANSGLQPQFTPQEIQAFAQKGNGDWRLDNILQNAAQQSHNLVLQGGSANNTYLLSVGFLDQGSNFVGPDYGLKRYNIRFNQSTDIGKLRVSTILSYAKSKIKSHSYDASTLVVDATRVPLYYSFKDSAGNFLTNPVSAQFNPKGILENGGFTNNDDDEVFGSITGEYPILQDLKIRGVFGGTIRSNSIFRRRQQVSFLPGGLYGADRETASANSKYLLTNTQLLLEYTKRFGEHDIKVLFGGTNESSEESGSQVTMQQTDPALGTPTTGTTIIAASSYNTNGTRPDGRPATQESSLYSLLGRINYAFRNRYFAEFVFRHDVSSNLSKGNRGNLFPSGSIGWNMTDENFMSAVRRISEIKLRASYGVLGIQNIPPYQYQTAFFSAPDAYAFNNASVAGSRFIPGNSQSRWESVRTFNLGMDLYLLKRKLSVSFDYFSKRTQDILVPRTDIPGAFGVPLSSLPFFNFAEVRNRGWEFSATYTTGKKLRQTFTINLADNLNELVKLNVGSTEFSERKEEFELLRRVGQPITVYYGYQRNGYFQNLDDLKNAPIFAGQNRDALNPGDIKFRDRNGDGLIDDKDKTILGNPFPRYTFGFTYSAQYKGFDLVLFIQGVGKRDAMIRGEQVEPFHFGYGGTMYRHQTDFWTPTNPNAEWPRLAEAGSPSNANNYRTGSDLYLFDASYARLKNLQFGYTLPASWTQKAKLQSARIYFTGQNLFTLTKLSFLDPEITEFDNNVGFNTGANSARAYPLPVFLGFGLDINF
jgi:TonB-dependent starch-binding outer membrane protein SusC